MVKPLQSPMGMTGGGYQQMLHKDLKRMAQKGFNPMMPMAMPMPMFGSTHAESPEIKERREDCMAYQTASAQDKKLARMDYMQHHFFASASVEELDDASISGDGSGPAPDVDSEHDLPPEPPKPHGD
jgi:hypothetical protein